jgi:transcriptional regulator with XRE-family HTH domain
MLRGKMYKTPSYRLKFLMNLLKTNIKEFSAKTGIPYRTIQNYLLKERQPNYENLQKIATHLCLNLNWLLTGEGRAVCEKRRAGSV